jgi:hypothetical protein
LEAFATAVVWLMALLGLRLTLRRTWPAIVVLVAIGTILTWPSSLSNYKAIAIACSLAGSLTMVWALRFGLVGLLTVWLCVYLWVEFPVTARPDAPYFATGLLAVAIIAAIGAYGAVMAARPHLASQRSPPMRAVA